MLLIGGEMKVRIGLLTVIVFFYSYIAAADINDKVEEMISLTGGEEFLTQSGLTDFLNKNIDIIAQNNKSMTPEKVATAKKSNQRLVSKIDMEIFRDKIVSLYTKNYTEVEIDAINAFYRSPVGKKMSRLNPKMMEEIIIIANQEVTKAVEIIKKEEQSKSAKK